MRIIVSHNLLEIVSDVSESQPIHPCQSPTKSQTYHDKKLR